MSEALKNRQPWPMKWIVLAIVVVIVPYTVITLRYRKPGPAFEPYEDIKARANASRLLSAGYRRIPIVAERPAENVRIVGGAAIATGTGGLPADLRATLVEPLLLPLEISAVVAASAGNAAQPYAIQITCTLPDDRQQLGGADFYVRGKTIVIAPTFERVAGGLETRSRTSAVLLTIPPDTLMPGNYSVTLVAERASRVWPLEMR